MPDEPTVPEFSLPDWGTEGAPPEPVVAATDTDDVPPIEISVEHPVLLAAGSLPPRWEVRTVHGVVTATGSSDHADPQAATESATEAALSTLAERASTMGANAVTDVALAVRSRKSNAVVTAWGTAVSFSR